MYKSFFGLKELPFRNNLDSAFFYEKASRLEILQALIYVVKRGDAIIKVTGEVGSGKTTLLRLVAQKLTDGFKLVYINSPNLSPKDLLQSVATELDISFSEDINKYQLLELIRQELLNRYSQSQKVVVLVDEAQSMSVDTLEELRLLTNFETEKDKLIQLVLFGQPELDLAINSPVLRQLKSRVTYNIHIPPLTVSDVYDYLNHRMRVASYKGLDFFNYKSAKRIHRLSQGLPRSINSIADQLLMSSFGLGDARLKSKHFKNLNALDLYSPNLRNAYKTSIIVLTASLILLVAGYFIYDLQYSVPENSTTHQVLTSPPSIEVQESPEPEEKVIPEIRTDELPPSDIIKSVDVNPSSLSEDISEPNSELKPDEGIHADELDRYSGTISSLVKLHIESERWLNGFKDTDYIIQLSTSSVDNFTEHVSSYKQHKNIMTNLHFMLVLNQEGRAVRIKTLYMGSSSYSFLRKELSKLPPSIQKAQPFISNASTLKESARLNTLKLKEIETHE